MWDDLFDIISGARNGYGIGGITLAIIAVILIIIRSLQEKGYAASFDKLPEEEKKKIQLQKEKNATTGCIIAAFIFAAIFIYILLH